MKPKLFVNDGTEFSIGYSQSGIVIRYRGNIRGFMVLIRNRELSYFNYTRLKSFCRKGKMLRVPGMKTKVW